MDKLTITIKGPPIPAVLQELFPWAVGVAMYERTWQFSHQDGRTILYHVADPGTGGLVLYRTNEIPISIPAAFIAELRQQFPRTVHNNATQQETQDSQAKEVPEKGS